MCERGDVYRRRPSRDGGHSSFRPQRSRPGRQRSYFWCLDPCGRYVAGVASSGFSPVLWAQISTGAGATGIMTAEPIRSNQEVLAGLVERVTSAFYAPKRAGIVTW